MKRKKRWENSIIQDLAISLSSSFDIEIAKKVCGRALSGKVEGNARFMLGWR